MIILSIDIGLKNFSYCILENSAEHPIRIIEWKNKYIVDETTRRKMSYETFVEKILEVLMETFDENMRIDKVLIENQPHFKNGVMKSVSMIVFTYFNLMKLQYGNVENVHFISASSKYKCKYSKLENSKTKSYKDRKMKSIEAVKKYLQENEQDIEKIESFLNQKKQDDLADSFLLAIYFIENNSV